MALVSLVPSSLFVVSGPFAAFDSLAFWKKIDLEAYEQKIGYVHLSEARFKNVLP